MQGSPDDFSFKTITYHKEQNTVEILDQTFLPGNERYVTFSTIDQVYHAIQSMQVRGAPLIGVVAAYGLAMYAKDHTRDDSVHMADHLLTARPTAVDLEWAINRIRKRIMQSQNPYSAACDEAHSIDTACKQACQNIGRHGARFITHDATVMVHCNAGALATSGIGTALGIIYTATKQQKTIKVFACETRPLLQGARLTAWELTKNGIETTVISDSMAATYLPQCSVVIVGADRIAQNGDTANKIGTHGLAILAKHYGIPFLVAAPSSSFDLACLSGDDIPIEERKEEELRTFNGITIVPETARIKNPAFDITPAQFITAFITELGVIEPPYSNNISPLISHL